MKIERNHDYSHKQTRSNRLIKNIKLLTATMLLIIASAANMFASAREYAGTEAEALNSAAFTYTITDNTAPPEEDDYGVKVIFNGSNLAGAELIAGTTYVPLKSYFAFYENAVITWDEATETATVKNAGFHIIAQKNANYITSNGRVFYSDSPVIIIGETLYIPVRSAAAATGAAVTWSENSSTVTVEARSSTIPSADEYYNADDLLWLSRIIHAESRGEPLTGKIAVGCVIINRMSSPDFPDSIYSVIFDSKHGTQFTPTASGTIYNTPTEESETAAKICLEGYTLSDSIQYFINESIATSTWVSTTRQYQLTIGNHDFYS
jgi:Cell wall hydrolyses involved in spore germination